MFSVGKSFFSLNESCANSAWWWRALDVAKSGRKRFEMNLVMVPKHNIQGVKNKLPCLTLKPTRMSNKLLFFCLFYWPQNFCFSRGYLFCELNCLLFYCLKAKLCVKLIICILRQSLHLFQMIKQVGKLQLLLFLLRWQEMFCQFTLTKTIQHLFLT